MINEDTTITDVETIRNLVNNASSFLPRPYRKIAEDLEIPLVDTQLVGRGELPQEGEGVTGYRFYRVAGQKRLSGIFNQYIPEGVETSEYGLHFWFDKAHAKAYMLASLRSDIERNMTGNYDYVLEEVNGIYKGVSSDEGFLMSEISPHRHTVMKVTNEDIKKMTLKT